MTVAVVIPTLDPESEMCVAAVDAVTATAPDVFVIVEHDQERAGFAETCNAGAARTTADVLVFLNDDTVVQTGWLGQLTAPLSTRNGVPSAAITGAALFYPDGQIQHTGVFMRRDQAGRLEAYNRRSQAKTGPVPAVTGACLAVRRDVWDDLGGFDEDYVNGYEDVDLCLRAREAGHEVVMTAAQVVHLESRSPGRFDHAPQNIKLLQERWGDLPV